MKPTRGYRAMVGLPEAAAHCGVRPQQLYGWIRHGKLKFLRVPGKGSALGVFLVHLEQVIPLAEKYKDRKARESAARQKRAQTHDLDRVSYVCCPCVEVARTPGWELTSRDRMELERRRELFLKRRAS